MVSVDQLKAVRAIAKTGSITAAARQLGMSQPGLSRLVERMEDQLDADLFLRGRSGAELTDAGRRVLQFAHSMVGDYETLTASISGTRRRRDDGSGLPVLKIVASTTPGEYLLPQIASGFARANRGVSVDTLITDSAAVAGLLMSGDFDVGFAGGKAEFGALHYVVVGRDEVVLAVPAGHPFAEKAEVTVTELGGERMLRRESGSGTYDVVRSALRDKGMQLPGQPAEVTLGSTQAVLQAVDSGLGIGFVTMRAIQQHAPSRVSAVRIAGLPVVRDLYLVHRSDKQLTETVSDFINYVQEWVRLDGKGR